MSEAREEATGALLALWNDVAPEADGPYNDWHANEHVPERLGVPGMLWGRRYAALQGTVGPRYLTLYGLRDAQVLEREAYRRLLSHPTPASAAMRPQLRNVSRWVCAVRAQRGLLSGALILVRTFDSAEAAHASLHASAPGAALLAERLHEASPLPWLQSGQEQGIAGRWLLALDAPGAAVPVRDALVYRALPVRPASPRA